MDSLNLMAALSAGFAEAVSSPRQILAWAAAVAGAALVVGGAVSRTMIPLRLMTVGSNIGFLIFGALHPSPVTLLVSALLLPINLYRLREMVRLTRRVAATQAASDLSGLWLKPYMKPRQLKPGQVLFSKGDQADMLYLLVDGHLQLVDITRDIKPGRIFGEIALFSPDQRRTHTAQALSACTVLTIDEATVKELFSQNPSFGFHLMALVAARLSNDVARAEQTLSGAPLPMPEPDTLWPGRGAPVPPVR